MHRQFFCCGSLIVNIISPGIPEGFILTGQGKGFIPFHIFNLFQIGYIADLIQGGGIFKPVADNDFPDTAVGFSQDIDRFVFGYL